jgi:hypothetical protein
MTEPRTLTAAAIEGGWLYESGSVNRRMFRLTIRDAESLKIILEIKANDKAVLNWLSNTGNDEPVEITFYGEPR